MRWLWLALACGRGAASGEWVALPEAEPAGLETRFLGSEGFAPTPQQAFDVRGRCPQLKRARAEPSGEVWYVTVEGEGLDQVSRIGAVIPGGKLAEVRYRPEGEGLFFPVACAECEVFFALDVEGHPVACSGPGRSLTMRRGSPG